MKKCLMIVLMCCLNLQIIPSGDGGSNPVPWFLGAIFVGGVYGVYKEITETIDYWTKAPDLICIDCKEPGKHANKLTKLPCGHGVCCLCKQSKVNVANQHNSKLVHICSENLVYPSCSCGKKFDFDHQEQQKLFEHAQAAKHAIRPFKFTLITNKCVTGCGNKISQVLDCGHSVCRSCLATQVSKAVAVTGDCAKMHCPKCNSSISAHKFKDLI